MLRGKLIFAILWNAISAFAIRAVIRDPRPGDQWLLILAGLLVLVGLALLLDVIVRYRLECGDASRRSRSRDASRGS